MPPADSNSATAIALMAALMLAPLAIFGLAVLFAGLTRTRSVAHCLFLCLVGCALAVLVFFLCGFAVLGPLGTTTGAHSSWIGSGPLFLHGQKPDAIEFWPAVWFGMIAASLACVIPIGAGVERWRTGAMLCSTAVLAGWTFPLFAHWIWAGGWGKVAFTDAAGSGCVQVMGGISALCAAWVLGPRRGKFNAAGVPLATPGHNATFIISGCLLAMAGWIGLNSAGSILFAGATYIRVPFIAVGTMLSAAAGAGAAAAITRIRFGKPDASLSANGWIAGLVASSAGCATAQPAQALLIGAVSGIIVIFSIEILEMRWRIDDPSGAISVHFLGGLWGVVAAGLFDSPERLLGQLLEITTLLGFVFPFTYATDYLINRFVPFRVRAEDERQGMDLTELGAGAYPEFMIHRDDLGFR